MKVKEVIEAVALIKNSLKGYEIIEDGSQEGRLVLKESEQILINCYGEKEVVRFGICDELGRNKNDLFLVMVFKGEKEDSYYRYNIQQIELPKATRIPYVLVDRETKGIVGTELNNLVFFEREGAEVMREVISKYAIESPRKKKDIDQDQVQTEDLKGTIIKLQNEVKEWKDRFDKMLRLLGEDKR